MIFTLIPLCARAVSTLVCAPVCALICALMISGCQSTPGSQFRGVDIDLSMPGEIARNRYAYIHQALEVLGESLSSQAINFDNVPMNTSMHSNRSQALLSTELTTEDALRAFAVNNLIYPGPYQLVQADTLSGRLEYRSEKSGAHLSITVQAARGPEEGQSVSFVVTDIFAQASLAKLSRLLPLSDGVSKPRVARFAANPAYIHVSHLDTSDDAGLLAYFESIPLIEREREDLLAIRAMLMMRLEQDKRARALVEQGIIRYPNSVQYYTLASLLFERAKHTVSGASESLSAVMGMRFNPRRVAENRRQIEQFLSIDNHL